MNNAGKNEHRPQSDIQKKIRLLQGVYLAGLTLLFFLVVLTPYFIKGNFQLKNRGIVREEIAEGAVIALLLIVGYLASILHKKEFEKYRRELTELASCKCDLENRLNEVFSYIGEVNVQLLEIKSVFSAPKRFPCAMINMRSAFWAITILLFLGGLGLPVPENPALMGGGYALHKHLSPPLASLFAWYLSIMAGDSLLFSSSYWLFTRPTLSDLLDRYVGRKRIEKYRTTFAGRAGWTLFLARFTFGIRALVYLAAGAARYPWQRFLAVDGVSVAAQVLLFVGIGYYAGERTKWAQTTGGKIAFLLGICALGGIIVSYLSSVMLKKLSMGKNRGNKELM